MPLLYFADFWNARSFDSPLGAVRALRSLFLSVSLTRSPSTSTIRPSECVLSYAPLLLLASPANAALRRPRDPHPRAHSQRHPLRRSRAHPPHALLCALLLHLVRSAHQRHLDRRIMALERHSGRVQHARGCWRYPRRDVGEELPHDPDFVRPYRCCPPIGADEEQVLPHGLLLDAGRGGYAGHVLPTAAASMGTVPRALDGGGLPRSAWSASSLSSSSFTAWLTLSLADNRCDQ